MPSSTSAARSRREDDLVLADKEVLRRAEDILTTMANTVSAMKLFPSDHSTVKTFVETLSAKFDEFFKTYARLEVGVEEYSFTCAGQVVYTDEMTIKSLPFFFFKDGTQILYFYRGLDRQELFDFLELIKIVSQKPGDDNDIVAALWESDFSNIQYYAPDEFIENQILAEKREIQADKDLPELPSDLAHETLEVKVDLAKFSQGRIELKPEDTEKFQWRPGADPDDVAPAPVEAGEETALAASPEDSTGLAPSPAAAGEPNLTDAEVRELDQMVHANRVLWPEEEFVNLTTEVVFLEADLAICASSLDVLFEFHLDQLSQGHFPVATMIIGKVRGLQSHLAADADEKSQLLEACLKKLLGPKSLEAVTSLLGTAGAVDWTALLSFFRLLGPMTLPTTAGLYEAQRDPDARAQILAFIEEMGAQDPGLIVRLANDSRPTLTLEIIRILIGFPEDKGIVHLSAFLMFKNRDLKLEVIHALGDRKDEMSNKILMGFLNDPDEELRIQSAMKLNPTEEKSRIVHIIREASEPGFRKKSLKEKQAILSFLGRTRSAEALAFLTACLGRTTLFPSSKNLEMRLAAVAGLESMGTGEAEATLEKGTRMRGRKVREACAEALARAARSATPKVEGP
jgi:HEAT repeat protein